MKALFAAIMALSWSTCKPAPTPPPPDASSSTGTPEPLVTCIDGRPRLSCTVDNDCNTGTQFCQTFVCGPGNHCDYTAMLDGTHCDPAVHSELHWSCAGGACCPRTEAK